MHIFITLLEKGNLILQIALKRLLSEYYWGQSETEIFEIGIALGVKSC